MDKKRTFLPSNKLLLSLLLFAFVLIIDQSYALRIIEKDADLIKVCCRFTEHDDLCVSSLNSDPRSSNANVSELDSIAMELAIANASKLLADVNQLKENTSDTSLKQSFVECSRLYRGMIILLRSSISCLTRNDPDCAHMFSMSAGLRAETCEDAFVNNNQKSPFTSQNQLVGRLCGIASKIATLVGWL